jgi:hypothetical protein
MMHSRALLSCVVLAAACADASGDSTPVTAAPLPQPLTIGPCRDGDPNDQRHGATCLCCHSDEFGVGGSIDRTGPPVARVVVVDAHGEVVDVVPNQFSNFFRHYPLVAPFRAKVIAPDGRTLEMTADAPTADCNRCHGSSVAPIHGP